MTLEHTVVSFTVGNKMKNQKITTLSEKFKNLIEKS